MAAVTVHGLTKRFGDFTAVAGLDLEIADGEFLTLLGPSGCGKTTTLRCLAGLEEPSSGEISIGGRRVTGPGVFVPPEKRNAGMVFQSYALWPHMTARGNVGYPLKLARIPRPQATARVDELLASVGLDGRGDHLASQLSGGQQQRVALARAMANRPQLLLFDEPLSNLDAKLRSSMRAEIRRLHRATATTSVYVTHDQEEAMVLADRIVIMDAGRVQQVGTPRELYTRPANRFVADFMGFENILDGRVIADGTGDFGFQPDAGGPALRVDGPAPVPAGGAATVAFRSAHLRVSAAGENHANVLKGRIVDAAYLGSRTELAVDCAGLPLAAYVDDADLVRLRGDVPAPGDDVVVTLPPRYIVAVSRA